jgi:hypothetical protein
MRKYLIFIYICIGTVASAQFRDNVFDNEKTSESQQERSVGNDKLSRDYGDLSAEQEESASGNGYTGKPGNPAPAPIDDYIPVLLLAGMALIVLYHKRKRSINL